MPPLGRCDHLARGILEIVGGDQLQPRLAQDAPAEFDIGAFEPHHQRHVQIDLARRRDDALGEHVAAQDAAKNVDQDRLDIRVGQDQLERDRDPLARRAAADIEKIGRHRAIQLDDVHRRHRQPGAVDHAADIAVELDVAELVLAGLALDRVLLVLVAQRLDLGMAEQRVVVDRHLGVERQQIARSPVTTSGLISISEASSSRKARYSAPTKPTIAATCGPTGRTRRRAGGHGTATARRPGRSPGARSCPASAPPAPRYPCRPRRRRSSVMRPVARSIDSARYSSRAMSTPAST